MGAESPTTTSLFSIGYGDRPWEEFLKRLIQHGIAYVVDVRSRPASRQSEFNRTTLQALLERQDIRYIYLGDQLGGQPSDPDCYADDGKVDYARCREKAFFREGLARLMKANEGGHRTAIMCSELDPERCHRSKMIGEALRDAGVPIQHIDRDGSVATQMQVIARLTGGQQSFFGEEFRSRGQYMT